MRQVEEACRQKIHATTGVHVRVRDVPDNCPVCEQDRWNVQKTVKRPCKTIAHGSILVTETVLECGSGCHHPAGGRVTHKPLANYLIPGRSVGYDVMVFVGRQRFLEHRQREDICEALLSKHGIAISTGEASALMKVFAQYLGRLHHDRSDLLKAAMQSDGGWPMHVDATGENGRGTLFLAMAGWRKWVLGAWKLSTERADLILPCLREVVEGFGFPCAVERDLGPAVTSAVNELLSELELKIPVLACHQHFLADIGTDLLKPAHNELRNLFRRMNVLPKLRLLVRDLGTHIGEQIGQARQEVIDWQKTTGHVIAPGRAGVATIRALGQWILDYKADATGLDFPFDRPWLDLYDRSMIALRATDAYLRSSPDDRKVKRTLGRLHRILEMVECEVPFSKITCRLRSRAGLFDELRTTLRFAKEPARIETERELETMAEQLDSLYDSLVERRPERGPAKDTRDAIDVILNHIDKHGSYLWGHSIGLPPEVGGGTRNVSRTNFVPENYFKGIKHGERQRSGRRILTQDLEHFPAEAALAGNLMRPDYVSLTCGSLDRLPQVFAELDRKDQDKKHRGEQVQNLQEKAVRLQIASASLSTADRRVIRTEAMNKKVHAAARSRAPRQFLGGRSTRQPTGS